MKNTKQHSKHTRETLNVPRTTLIEKAFENDDDIIKIENSEEYQREIWLFGKEKCIHITE